MLPDFERKLLRILVNFSIGRRRMPSIYELTVKTGRKEAGVLEALASLKDHGFIEWDLQKPEQITVIRQWETDRDRVNVWRGWSSPKV